MLKKKGKWRKKNNVYTFLSQYEGFENDAKFILGKDLKKDIY